MLVSKEQAIVDAAIGSRRSIRAFLPTPVAREDIEQILEVSARAPSGTNIQPWKVTVLTGQAKAKLAQAILAIHNDPALAAQQVEEYPYYPREWISPYIERRRKVGLDLYSLLGLERDNKAGMHAQFARNYRFFDAPVGLIFTIDRGAGAGLLARLRHVPRKYHGRRARPRPRHLPASGVHPVSQDHCRTSSAAAHRDAGMRHGTRLRRSGQDREHPSHGARTGGKLCSLCGINAYTVSMQEAVWLRNVVAQHKTSPEC